jgi:hypothetical protein
MRNGWLWGLCAALAGCAGAPDYPYYPAPLPVYGTPGAPDPARAINEYVVSDPGAGPAPGTPRAINEFLISGPGVGYTPAPPPVDYEGVVPPGGYVWGPPCAYGAPGVPYNCIGWSAPGYYYSPVPAFGFGVGFGFYSSPRYYPAAWYPRPYYPYSPYYRRPGYGAPVHGAGAPLPYYPRARRR